MVKEIRYTNIRRILDDLMDHPLLRDVTLEQVVRHTVRFIGLHGYPQFYQDKISNVVIEDFRGLLPCDLISIKQVKDTATGICMRSMTDVFPEGLEIKEGVKSQNHEYQKTYGSYNKAYQLYGMNEERVNNNTGEVEKPWYIPANRKETQEPAFKIQGRVIYTTFPEGIVEIAYKSIPVDDDGFPLIIDNENYLAALEAYIKKQVFIVKFDTGKINASVLQNAKQEYAFLSGELMDEFTIPSVSEAEAMSRYALTLLPKIREFDKGFRHLGDREYLWRH